MTAPTVAIVTMRPGDPVAPAVGDRFGRLLVVAHRGGVSWECNCDCGNPCTASTSELSHGRQSCGCIMREAFEETQASRRRRSLRPWPAQAGAVAEDLDDGPDFEPPPAKAMDPAARAAFLFAPEAVLWVIYASPKGYPDRFVLRRWVLDDGDPIPDAEPTVVAETIEAARAAMPGPRMQVKASTAQDPTVVEVWR